VEIKNFIVGWSSANGQNLSVNNLKRMSGETLKTVIQRHVSSVSVTLAASFKSQNDLEDRSTPGSDLVLEKSF